jgi:hypothetical protein
MPREKTATLPYCSNTQQKVVHSVGLAPRTLLDKIAVVDNGCDPKREEI